MPLLLCGRQLQTLDRRIARHVILLQRAQLRPRTTHLFVALAHLLLERRDALLNDDDLAVAQLQLIAQRHVLLLRPLVVGMRSDEITRLRLELAFLLKQTIAQGIQLKRESGMDTLITRLRHCAFTHVVLHVRALLLLGVHLLAQQRRQLLAVVALRSQRLVVRLQPTNLHLATPQLRLEALDLRKDLHAVSS